MGTNSVNLYSGDSSAYLEASRKFTQKISEQATPEEKVDILYDHGKKIVRKLQDGDKGLVSTTARPDGSLAIQVGEKLLEPKEIRQLLPKKVDDLRTKKRVAGHVPTKFKKTSFKRKSQLEGAIKGLEAARLTNIKPERLRALQDHAMLIETIAKKALEKQQGVTTTPQGHRQRVNSLDALVKRAEAQRIRIQSAQPDFISLDPVTKKEINVTAHRMQKSGASGDTLMSGHVVPNGEDSPELKSFYTATVSVQTIGRHAVCDTEEKAASLKAYLDALPPRFDTKAQRIVFCQLNSQEVKKEKEMIENQHREMTALESDNVVEVAHLNLPTNGIFDFNRSLKRILPSGLVDFFLPGEKESALQNGPAFVKYLSWLKVDKFVSIDQALENSLKADATAIISLNLELKKRSKELEGLVGNAHKIKSKTIEKLIRDRAALREKIQSDLKNALAGNNIASTSSTGEHFIKLLKSQLGIEYVSRGEELMLKNLVNNRLGIHSFSNCKSGFDRTGIAFAVDLAQAQFREQVTHTLNESSKCDTVRKEVLALTDPKKLNLVKGEPPAERLTKVLAAYAKWGQSQPQAMKELAARQRSGRKPGDPDFFSPITAVMNSSDPLLSKLAKAEKILAESFFTDSEKRMLLKQVLHLEVGVTPVQIKAGEKWIVQRAEDKLAASWDTISRENIIASQSNLRPVSQDAENFRTLVMKNLLEIGLPIIHRGIGVLGLKWGKGHGAQLIPLRFIPSHIHIDKGKGVVEKVEIVNYDKSGNVKGLTDEGHRLMTRLSTLRGA